MSSWSSISIVLRLDPVLLSSYDSRINQVHISLSIGANVQSTDTCRIIPALKAGTLDVRFHVAPTFRNDIHDLVLQLEDSSAGVIAVGHFDVDSKERIVSLDFAHSQALAFGNTHLLATVMSPKVLTNIDIIETEKCVDAWLLNRNLRLFSIPSFLVSELSYESKMSFTVPHNVLKCIYSTLIEKINNWKELIHSVKVAQCAFDSQDQAKGHSYVELSVISAESLCQTQHSWNAKEDIKAPRIRMLFDNLKTAKLSMKVINGQSNKLSNPYVQVSYTHPGSGETVIIGRTNTEYRTTDAIFGTNANRALCDHGKIQTNYTAYGHTKLNPGNTFGFYLPSCPTLGITFQLFHERFSISNGVVPIPMMECTIALGLLVSENEKLTSLDFVAGDVVSGTLVIKGKVDKLDKQVVLVEKQELYSYDLDWTKKLLDELENQREVLKCNIDNLETVIHMNSSVVKPSTEKKSLLCAAVPTNLHVSLFGINDFVCAFTSSGIPCAHMDLSSSSSLNSLNKEYESLKQMEELNVARIQALHLVESKLFYRHGFVLSQAVSVLVSSFVTEVFVKLVNGCLDSWLVQLERAGVLFEWESLVSTHGKECTMLNDAIYVLNELDQTLNFNIVHWNEHKFQVKVTKLYTVTIFMNLHQNQPPNKVGPIVATIALFSQGINERQSVANVTGVSRLQSETNKTGLLRIQEYWSKMKDITNVKEEKMFLLESAVNGEQDFAKDINILLFAGDVCRHIGGCRITSCKSGKDRTAMSITLEQARVLMPFCKDSDDVLLYANIFREYGVRLDIAEKNVGRPLYSFNTLQRKLLPKLYRPPLSTIQDLYLSITARDS